MPATSDTARDRREPYAAWLALVLAIATLAVYAPVLGHEFVAYDDDLYITTVPPIADGLTGDGVRWALTSTQGANWFPLTRLSWLLDAELFGLDPRAFHATNALLHAIASGLLLLALARLTGAPGRSAIVAAIFALHPLHVESVAWAAARKDVLSGVFATGMLLAYARSRGRGGRPGIGRVAVLLALGLMSKPTLVVWPFVLLLLDFWPLGRLEGRGALSAAAREKWPLFALAVAGGVVTLATQSGGAAVRTLEQIPVAVRFANALAAYAHYTVDAFWPSALAVFYPHPGPEVPLAAVLGGGALLLGGTLAALARARSEPALVVGWLWYLGALVPVIGLVQVGQAARADRYTYLPLIGLAVAVVWGLSALCGSRRVVRRVAAAGAFIAIAALALATRAQLATWRDSEALFQHALRVTERNHVAHINLGLALERQGRLEEASAHLLAALRIVPASATGAGILGAVRLAQGREEEATLLYRRALEIEPTSARWRRGLARALVARGRADEAARVLEAADLDQPARSDR